MRRARRFAKQKRLSTVSCRGGGILDFSGVSFMDSSGIAVVLRVKKRMEETDGDVFLLDPAPQCARVLRTSGIERFVAIKFTEGKAAR